MDVPPELSRFLDGAKRFSAEYGALLQVLIFPLIAAVVGGIKLFRDRQRDIPDLHLELVDVGRAGEAENVTFGLKATNLGEQPATRSRYIWTPRSSLIMTPVPAGFLVAKGEPRRFEFSMDSDELIGHGLAGVFRRRYRMLGWLQLAYYAGWGLWKKVDKAIVVGDSPDMPIQLAKAPRRPLGAIVVPLGHWQKTRIRDKDISDLDQYLQQCRVFLAARGIEVELLAPVVSLNRLFMELQRRRWRSSYEPGGRGYEVHAEKHDPPSTIRLSANTLVDAATLVVKSAVEADEEHGL